MDLYYAGTEQTMWRTLLKNEGVEHVSLSYIGLRRRIKDPSGWRIADHYPGQKVYLDGGAYTLNKDDSPVGEQEAAELAGAYIEFVRANVDAIEFASDFDALVLGYPGIVGFREDCGIPDDKMMPVWHSDWGTGTLLEMAGRYPRVGVLQGDADADITPLLRRLSGQMMLHGVAMTQMDAMSQVPWASVGSTSWISPVQYGDTFVWTGRELKRYPKKYKDQARKRHRTWLADQGFDTGLIDADDNGELLRLSIWSWKHFAASLQKGRGVTSVDVLRPFGNAEPVPAVVDAPEGTARNAELVPSRKKLLPVLGITRHVHADADGNEVEETRLSTPPNGLLRCNNCFMREKCPEMQADSDCAYEIPAQVRTGGQLAAVQDWLIETQTQRVAFMRLVEQAEGGYSDANTSAEMDRLQKMIRAKTDAGKDGLSINIANIATPGGPGMISRIFGQDVTDKMGALPAPVDANAIIDAEIVT